MDKMDSVNDNMQIIPYDKLNVTTMTLVMSLTGGVNIEAAFHLLPITRIPVYQTRETSKCKLPHCDVPGSILSMRFRGNVRGIIRNKSDPFKNAVTIDISTKRKNISLKLSAFSIQMCGASSKEDGVEAATHVIDHLINIQNLLCTIQQNLEQTLAAIEWVKENTKGESIEKPHWVSEQYNNITLNIYRPNIDFSIVKPTAPIPDHLNPDVVKFILLQCDDFLFHGDMCKKLDFIPKITTIIEMPLALKHVDMAMVNYNYSLGFEVDRDKLNQFIDGRNGFISRYNNALATSVTIELPYEPPENSSIKRRKNKIPHHTFLVYRSGSITQSGPGGELMEKAYYLFIKTIASLLPHIQYGYQAHDNPIPSPSLNSLSTS